MKHNMRIALATVASTLAFAGVSAAMSPVFAATSDPILKQGSQGDAVKTLQTDLNAAGYKVGTPDGIFGPGTVRVVKKFQENHHLAADGVVGAGTWKALRAAMGPSSSDLHNSVITFNGQKVSSEAAFAWNGTTYMPIWYVIQLLKTIHVKSQWDGQHWALTTSGSEQPDLSKLPINKRTGGSMQISLNGQVVAYLNGITFKDPASKVNTTYMPIWYVMQTLNLLQFQTKWDGTTWDLKKPLTYTDFDKSGNPLNSAQVYQTEADAEKVLLKVPGGTIKDNLGNVVFTEPDFTAYAKDGTTVLGDFTTEQPAQAAVGNVPGGTVKDITGKVVFTEPDFTAYAKDGTTVLGDFTTEQPAQAAVGNVPGGTVKDITGKVVFAEPDFTAYAKDGTTVLGDFTTEQPAQAALVNVPGGTVKDITGKVVFTEPDFTAYAKDGQVVGDYTTQAAAQTALVNSPGGMVKDATGKVLYTAPDFAAYTSPTKTAMEFTTLAAASQAVNSRSTGYVVDKSTNKVVQLPSAYEYLDTSGNWHSTILGYLGTAPGFAKPGNKYISISSSSGQAPQVFLIAQADGTYSGALMGTFQNPFQTADLRDPAPATVTEAQIDNWFKQYGSPLQGLGQSFIKAQATYGVNATYLVAHAVHETGWGKSAIAMNKDNLFGYGAYDANPATDAGAFPSNDYAIQFEAWVVRNSYLEPSGSLYSGPTLNGMNVHYATDPLWAARIASLMSQYVKDTGGSATQYPQFQVGQPVAMPSSTTEPVYRLNGAQGTIMGSPYGNLPVYATPVTGADQMFPGPLQKGDRGRAVRLLQSALINSDLQPDGVFGPLTQQAVQQYQQSHGLSVTGICDLPTWESLFPTPSTVLSGGTRVTIDQMRQGMLGNLVTLWFHVTATNGISGWVDSEYVDPEVVDGSQSTTNMFRVNAQSGYSVPVYGTENASSAPIGILHNGDDVVTSQLWPSNGPYTPDGQGFVQIRWVNQQTGQASTGYIRAAMMELTPLPMPIAYAGSGMS